MIVDDRIGAEDERRIAEAMPAKAATPRKPRRLLVVTLSVRDGVERKGSHKSIPFASRAFELMGEKTGAFAATVSNDLDLFRPAALAQFDAVCFNNTGGVLFEDDERRESLVSFVSNGGGIVGVHAAAATFCQYPVYDQWPAFGEMLGGYENGGHPWRPDETITIKLDDPDHPVNAAFGGKGFEIADEVFQFRDHYSRSKLHVLASIDTDRTDMGPHRRFLPERAADRDFAMSWVRQYGDGRVFYTSFGHNIHLFWNRQMLQHFLAGIQFAMGDLEGDASPSGEALPLGPCDC